MNFSDPYDSLEENESAISGATFGERIPEQVREIRAADLSTIVPLYGKETFKRDVGKPSFPTKIPTKIKTKSRKESREKAWPERKSKGCGSVADSLKGLGLETRSKKSYLDLFHAKIGLSKAKAGSDTTRGVGDVDTCRSLEGSFKSDNSSLFSDAKSFVSDSSSFYLQYMKDDKSRREILRKTAQPPETLNFCDSKISLTSASVLNMKSVSQVSSLQPQKPIRPNKSLLDVPVLGSLGPDPTRIKDKMVKLKRQQSYGQRASNQNRIKMLEKNVIRNFELELRKSNEVDQCANCVLSAE